MTDKHLPEVDHSRRAALARLGLGALAIYAAPTITRLDQAKAAVPSGGCPPGACGPGPGGGPPRGR